MKKIFFFTFTAYVFCAPAFAYDDPFADTRKSLKDEAFVFETGDDSSQESLNRISGQIDRGYTLPEQEYRSSDQSPAGPFRTQESKDKTRQSY